MAPISALREFCSNLSCGCCPRHSFELDHEEVLSGHQSDANGQEIPLNLHFVAPFHSGTLGKKSDHAWKENFATAWAGFTFIASSAEQFVEGTPFATPLAAFNLVIETIKAVAENRESLKNLMDEARTRLSIVNSALLDAMTTKTEIAAYDFAKIMISKATELYNMSHEATWKEVLKNEANSGKLESLFRSINSSSDQFELKIVLSIDHNLTHLEDILQTLRRDNWPASDEARFESSPHDPCTPETRVEILRRISDWATDSTPESPSLFWLCGPAGTGKSTIAYSACEELKNKSPSPLGASFFCSRHNARRRERRRVLPTIVKQLADCSRWFAKALNKDGRTDRVFSVKDQIEDLVMEPWRRNASTRPTSLPPHVIVVDALDEIDGGGADFLDELFRAVSQTTSEGQLLRGLKFLVTSRKDDEIAALCSRLPLQAIIRLESVDELLVFADIHRTLETKLPDICIDHAEEIRRIAEEAKGSYIFAATVIRYVNPKKPKLAPSEQAHQSEKFLRAWPEDTSEVLPMDKMYHDILVEAFGGLPHDAREARLSALSTIICSFHPLPTSEIAQLSAGIDQGTVILLVNALHSVLYTSEEDRCIYTYHKSFGDFLLSSERDKYFVSKDQKLSPMDLASVHCNLSMACLEAMRTLHFNVLEIPSSFESDHRDDKMDRLDLAVRYACWYWGEHALLALDRSSASIPASVSRLIEMLDDFFDERVLYGIEIRSQILEAAAGETSEVTYRIPIEGLLAFLKMLQQLEKLVAGYESLIQKLAALRRLLVDFAFLHLASTDSSPRVAHAPHLYLSSLAVQSEEKSSVVRKWKSLFPSLPIIRRKMAANAPGLCAEKQPHVEGHWLFTRQDEPVLWLRCDHFRDFTVDWNEISVGTDWSRIQERQD